MVQVFCPQQNEVNIRDLWHPYFVLYLGHVVAAGISTIISIHHPCMLIVVMLLSGLVFVCVILFPQFTAWGYGRADYIFWGVALKWLIVNALAAVPVLYLRAYKPTEHVIRIVGIFVYSILGANIVWTFFMDAEGQIIEYLNRATGVMLTISLITHCCALYKHGQELFEMKNGNVYGFGTTFPWLICYTVWNVLFIAKITIGGTLQDMLFWALMFAYWALDHPRHPIEFYFAFARPVQLGTYIAYTEWMGTFVPFFYNAPELEKHCPLPVNGHAFFFFVVVCNLLWSCVCTYWAFGRFINGIDKFHSGFDGEGFQKVFEMKDSDSSDSDSSGQ